MRHGEYKTPGGKLVVADFAVRDGAVRDLVVSGDFFLYPEEALTTIRERGRGGAGCEHGRGTCRARARGAGAGGDLAGFFTRGDWPRGAARVR